MESELRDSLLLISDLHFWEVVWNPLRLVNKRLLGNLNVFLRRRHEFRTDRASEYADELARQGVSTLLACGDFTSTATEKEYGQARAFLVDLASRDLKPIAIPGNHDVYTYEALRKKRFERYLGGFSPSEQAPYRSQLPGGTPLIVAPTVCPNLISSRGRISEKAIEATARLVREAPAGPVLVLSHYPLLHHTHGYSSSSGRRLMQAQALREALGGLGRKILCLAGHVHRFSYSQDDRFEQMRHATVPALFMDRPGLKHRGGFLRVELRQDGFQLYQHWRTEAWQCRERQAKAIPPDH